MKEDRHAMKQHCNAMKEDCHAMKQHCNAMKEDRHATKQHRNAIKEDRHPAKEDRNAIKEDYHPAKEDRHLTKKNLNPIKEIRTNKDEAEQWASNAPIFITSKKPISMAKNETRRLSPKQIVDDTNVLSAVQNISDYAPANDNYAVKTGVTKQTTMQQLQAVEMQAEATLKASRDNATAAEWDFHNYILGVKQQVMAQYGANSNELQGLGLKKKTEYKAPVRRSTPPPAKV